MRAYIDTSCLVAVAFDEPGAPALRRRLRRFAELFSSNLLEAELRSALHRENVEGRPPALDVISWVVPRRSLGPEIEQVLTAGYVRGADCWHLATALYLAAEPGEIAFLTLDEQQGQVARALGFK